MDTSRRSVEIGPRTAGSEANTRQRKLVADHFTKAAARSASSRSGRDIPMTGERLSMANLIGSWQPGSPAAGRDRCSLRHPAAPRPGGRPEPA